MLSKFPSIYGYFWMLYLHKETFTLTFPPSFNNSMSVIILSGHLLPPAAVGLSLPYTVDCNLSQIDKYSYLESVLPIAPDMSEQTQDCEKEGCSPRNQRPGPHPEDTGCYLQDLPRWGRRWRKGTEAQSFPAVFVLLLFWLCICLVGINLFQGLYKVDSDCLCLINECFYGGTSPWSY